MECREWSAQITDGDLLCLYGRRKVTSVIELGVCSPRFCSQPDLVLFLWMPNPSAGTRLSLGEDGEPVAGWSCNPRCPRAVTSQIRKRRHHYGLIYCFLFSPSLKSKRFPGINERISTTRYGRRKSNFLVRDWQQRYARLRD